MNNEEIKNLIESISKSTNLRTKAISILSKNVIFQKMDILNLAYFDHLFPKKFVNEDQLSPSKKITVIQDILAEKLTNNYEVFCDAGGNYSYLKINSIVHRRKSRHFQSELIIIV